MAMTFTEVAVPPPGTRRSKWKELIERLKATPFGKGIRVEDDATNFNSLRQMIHMAFNRAGLRVNTRKDGDHAVIVSLRRDAGEK